ncbi:hypothetical protein EII29_10370 [Leptotrichia sp. OH3620_COT-345]|uniref:hypothetical protein n=1 Tax=Leptotrichia sp. OH3620_COT-345 TaxID=2491048 RepID=UPI000F65143F|nr:hypothetical protein [Leptotrichia sp. OH3620_COT-345]RRD38437.1 hypothetical protein EII29_10370 [Leptotrichia sp. OH3620_COT-345]
MKKIFAVLFLIVSVCIFSNLKEENVISQKELLQKLDFSKVQIYEKYKEVYARKAVEGEKIKTYTKDGFETENTAKKGDYIVKNNTEAKEMYIISEEKFNSRYEFKAVADSEWKIYKPIGKIKGIKVNVKILKQLGIKKGKKEFYIIANWGEKMTVKINDYLVSPLDNTEVYRIAEKEFFETYREIK